MFNFFYRVNWSGDAIHTSTRASLGYLHKYWAVYIVKSYLNCLNIYWLQAKTFPKIFQFFIRTTQNNLQVRFVAKKYRQMGGWVYIMCVFGTFIGKVVVKKVLSSQNKMRNAFKHFSSLLQKENYQKINNECSDEGSGHLAYIIDV